MRNSELGGVKDSWAAEGKAAYDRVVFAEALDHRVRACAFSLCASGSAQALQVLSLT